MVPNKAQTKHDSYARESARRLVSRHNGSAENVDDSTSESDTEESTSATQTLTDARNVSANTSAFSVTYQDPKFHGDTKKTAVPSTSVSPKALVILAFVSVIAVIVGVACNYNASKMDMAYMRETYPWQANETWDNIEAVITDIRHPAAIHPAVFMFLYNAGTNNITRLVHDVATYASERLDGAGDFIEMMNTEFHSEEAVSDYGYLVDKYAQPIAEKKVMVVQDLQNISGQVAQAFHSFCDEISPLVESVVYIFTLQVDSLQGKREAIAERQLKASWADLDEDKLLPLITRVTGSVF